MDYAADAREVDRLIAASCVYLDRFPGGEMPAPSRLSAERAAVHDASSLLRYA
jgi:hypothetical protein